MIEVSPDVRSSGVRLVSSVTEDMVSSAGVLPASTGSLVVPLHALIESTIAAAIMIDMNFFIVVLLLKIKCTTDNYIKAFNLCQDEKEKSLRNSEGHSQTNYVCYTSN